MANVWNMKNWTHLGHKKSTEKAKTKCACTSARFACSCRIWQVIRTSEGKNIHQRGYPWITEDLNEWIDLNRGSWKSACSAFTSWLMASSVPTRICQNCSVYEIQSNMKKKVAAQCLRCVWPNIHPREVQVDELPIFEHFSPFYSAEKDLNGPLLQQLLHPLRAATCTAQTQCP